MIILRDYQLAALRICKDRYKSGVLRQLIALPTGTGKTIVFAHAKEVIGLDGRVLVLAHRRELIEQTCKVFRRLGYQVGRETAQHTSYSRDQIVVASVQALGRCGSSRMARLQPDSFGLVICDEAHHSVANTYRNVFEHFGILAGNSRVLLLGVTATPVRGDHKPLGNIFEELVYHMDIRKAVMDGWLVDIKGVRAKAQSNLDCVRVLKSGDFDPDKLGEIVNNHKRNALVLKSWKECAAGRQTIVFCATVQHAKDMAETFRMGGIEAEAIWGDDINRNEKLERHRAGKLRVLANCEVLTEGYDDWSVSCIVMARPTQSELLFVQMIGRGTRIPQHIDNLNVARQNGCEIVKSDCLIIDVVDNTTKHTLITLPILFGAPETHDYNGAFAVGHQMDRGGNTNPAGTAPSAMLVAGVKPLIREVDLLGIRWKDPIFVKSKLKWAITDSGDHILSLPKKHSFTIHWSRGGWEVQAKLGSLSFTSGPFASLEVAFRDVEHSLHVFCGDIVASLKRERYAKQNSANPAAVPERRKIAPPPKDALSSTWFNNALRHWQVADERLNPWFENRINDVLRAKISRMPNRLWRLQIREGEIFKGGRLFDSPVAALVYSELMFAEPQNGNTRCLRDTDFASTTQLALLHCSGTEAPRTTTVGRANQQLSKYAQKILKEVARIASTE